MAYLEYFPPAVIALQEELTHHPKLQERLAKHAGPEFEVKIAEIAAYCDVLLDGAYTQEDINGLCDLLVRKLQAKRSIIILPQ